MIISCINLKGGVGKTTSAIALATAAVRDGHSAVVLDADPQAGSTQWAAEVAEAGHELPFEVRPANVCTIKRLKNSVDEVIVIDCPARGEIGDSAAAAADFIVVPTSPRTMDMARTLTAVEVLENAGRDYAVLLTFVRAGTLSLESALAELDGDGIPRFEATVPRRKALESAFGDAFGDDLFGYEQIFQEIKEEL